jgi:hypothetical protein
MWSASWLASAQLSTGLADLRGHETGFVAGQAVSPLRFASVEMTILLEHWRYGAKFCFLSEKEQSWGFAPSFSAHVR